jgi:hypothetical protein
MVQITVPAADPGDPGKGRYVTVVPTKARREAGEALTDIGRSCYMSHSTISRLAD